jgi:hypothetical protein
MIRKLRGSSRISRCDLASSQSFTSCARASTPPDSASRAIVLEAALQALRVT